MENIDALKSVWQEQGNSEGQLQTDSFNTIIKQRMKKENRKVMRYFWASFVYQNIVAGITSRLIFDHFSDPLILIGSLVLMISSIYFGVVLMKRFRQMNKKSPDGSSLIADVQNQHDRIMKFFKFKQIFEWILVPVVCFITTAIIFQLWVAGPMIQHPVAFFILWMMILSAFILAIRNENKNQFREPLRRLSEIIADLKTS